MSQSQLVRTGKSMEGNALRLARGLVAREEAKGLEYVLELREVAVPVASQAEPVFLVGVRIRAQGEPPVRAFE